MSEELQQLKDELEQIEIAIMFMQNADNFCYSTGRIFPLLEKEKDLNKRIAELISEELTDE